MTSLVLDRGSVGPGLLGKFSSRSRRAVDLTLQYLAGRTVRCSAAKLRGVLRTANNRQCYQTRALPCRMESQKWLYCIGRIHALTSAESFRPTGFDLSWKILPRPDADWPLFCWILNSHWRLACDCTAMYLRLLFAMQTCRLQPQWCSPAVEARGLMLTGRWAHSACSIAWCCTLTYIVMFSSFFFSKRIENSNIQTIHLPPKTLLIVSLAQLEVFSSFLVKKLDKYLMTTKNVFKFLKFLRNKHRKLLGYDKSK